MLDKTIIMYYDITLTKTKANKVEVRASSGVSGEILTAFKNKYPDLIGEFKRSPIDKMPITIKYFWHKGKHEMLIKYNGNEPEGF